MKKLRLLIPVILFLLCCFNTGFSQKKVSEVYHFYELNTYHLAINKIKKLKPKYQTRTDVQLILADCYWNTGDRKRSTQLYRSIALHQEIPASFQDKFVLATTNKIQQQPPSQPEIIAFAKEAPKLEKTLVNPSPAPRALIQQEEVVKNAKPSTSIHISATPRTSEFTQPSNSFAAPPPPIPKGKYRIRVGASTDLGDFDLPQIETVGMVEVQEWADKKIVFAGYYDSPDRAQSFIDLYLKEEYKNAVVVVKKDGRYRSVR